MDFDDYDDDVTDDAPDEMAEDEIEDVVTDDLEDLVTEEADMEPASLETGMEGFEEWCQTMEDLGAGLTEETLTALWEEPDQRDYIQTELVDTALHPDFEAQRSILTDRETGLAVKDEAGHFVDCPRNTKGAQRPDGMMVDDTGVHLREAKNYSNLNNLEQNIKHQTESRRSAFGEDVDLTYVVAPNFTIEEAEKLQSYVEDKLGVNLEWQFR